MGNLTLGSLFSGSGGFELGALMSGITPIWASEIEPFCIRVTTKRMPFVKHYGDVNKINGAEIEPVDIITFGSPCTNLSVAGKREGLSGEQSALFFQAIRVIKEMRHKTNGKSPRFIVFENVPGVFSSGKGSDFHIILSEIVKIKDETLDVPMPEKWQCAGEIMGDGFSVAYRTIDAQFFGVAQRRRRCYLVADFTGECAGKILFESEGVSGYFAESGGAREGTAADAESGVGDASRMVLNDHGGAYMNVSTNVTGTLRAEEHGHQPLVFEPGAVSRTGGHAWHGGIAGTLRAEMGDNQLSVAIPINTQVATRHKALGKSTGFGVGENGDPAFTLQAAHSHAVAVAVENHPADSRIKLDESGTVQTLTSRMGTGGNNVPLVMNERQYALTVGENVANTLTSTDYKGTQCVFEPCSESKAYGICSQTSNSMQSGNPESGIYEADTSRTLDANGGNPACNQGGTAVVTAIQGSMIGRELKNGPQGSGINEGICFTLTEADRHAVAYDCRNHAVNDVSATLQAKNNGGFSLNYINPVVYSLDRASYNQGKNAQFDFSIQEEQAQTLLAKGPSAVAQPASFYPQMKAESQCFRQDGTANTIVNGTCPGFHNGIVEPAYAVRRLIPSECALLQGFPSNWCAGLGTPTPTEAEIAWWDDVFEAHRIIIGKSSKPKSRAQIIKWLRNPHSDAAEYKMWGNGVALPCVCFVLSGIEWAVSQEEAASKNCLT